ncbi:superinfection immunity protein [Cytophagaceae bacterium DM2B3-1]|uniref:Superinfection immunity protein n=1 Tax=Xanthocytophaga flava TaxID=3048013 RepID=A0ABT7CET9_9BACT|nr:superinfection immunity protein [Xanthocytophaga flavus]MDJ1468877.1 superinfection immunity protein [Xanthocytophaga flavus]MDJ1492051.1 superinfection immunity protein [Xanthocytophaga flavus]
MSEAISYIFIIYLFIYFIPSTIGYKKPNAKWIIGINLLLGWTVIGWIIAMIWAVRKESKPDRSIEVNQKRINNALQVLEDSHKRGEFSDAEYQIKRREIIFGPREEKSEVAEKKY